MKRNNIIGIVAAVIVVAAVVALSSWLLLRKEALLVQGTVDATSYKASSKIAGRIEEMKVGEGERVTQGQLLYILSTPEIEAKLRQARAAQSAAAAEDKKALAGARVEQVNAALHMWQKAQAGLSLAQTTYDRIRNLYEQGVVPAQKYDEALAELNAMKATASAAESEYRMAKSGTRSEDKAAAAALVEQAASVVSEVEVYASDAFVYSPVEGEISTVIAEQGELVGAGYPVVTILDLNDLWVSFNLKETMLPKIRVGTRMTAYVPALDDDVELEVYYIAVQADFATWSATRTRGGFDVRTFNVKARPTRAQSGLRPGMSAIVDWNLIE